MKHIVAKLMRIPFEKRRQKRWDPNEHMRWLKRTWGRKQLRLVDKYLLADRAERRTRPAKRFTAHQ